MHTQHALGYLKAVDQWHSYLLFCFLSSAWIGSISFGLSFVFGPIATTLITRFGCRVVTVSGAFVFGLGLFSSSFVDDIYQLYVTYSLILPIGSSFCYFASVLILSEYFSKRLVLVNGIALAGCGLGTITLAPLMNLLLSNFHWRQALRILSATSLVLTLCGLIYFIVPAPVQLRTVRNRKTTKKLIKFSLFKNRAYTVWVAGNALVNFGFYMPYVHMVRAKQCIELDITLIFNSINYVDVLIPKSISISILTITIITTTRTRTTVFTNENNLHHP